MYTLISLIYLLYLQLYSCNYENYAHKKKKYLTEFFMLYIFFDCPKNDFHNFIVLVALNTFCILLCTNDKKICLYFY